MHHNQPTKKTAQFINLYLRYSRFYGLINLMAKSTFHHPTPKVKSFPEFAPAFKYQLIPSIFFFFFFWDAVNFRVPWPERPQHVNTKMFWETFNLRGFVSACKESGYFIDLFWRYGWLKNPKILLAKNILTYLRNKNFLKYCFFMQGHRKQIFHYRRNSEKANDQSFQ